MKGKIKNSKYGNDDCLISLLTIFIILILIFIAYTTSSSVIPKNFTSYQWKQFWIIPLSIASLFLITVIAILIIYLKKIAPLYSFLIVSAYIPLIIYVSLHFKFNNLIQSLFFYSSFGVLSILYCSIKNKIKINMWIIFTVIGILSLYIIGMYFIDAYTGEQKLNLLLNNCSNTAHQRLGEIKCEGLDGHVIVNEEVQCYIKSKYNISRGVVKFTFSNGTSSSKKLTKPIKFIIPKDMIKIYFKFTASDKKNNTICLNTAKTVRYPTYSEFKENKIRFIKYMLSLFGFALLSIPLLVKTIKELSESK